MALRDDVQLDLEVLLGVEQPAELVAAERLEGGDGRGLRGGTALSLGLVTGDPAAGLEAASSELAKKAMYRRAVHVHGEAPANVLQDIRTMPRRENFAPGADGDALHDGRLPMVGDARWRREGVG